jgi:ribosome-binding protein aMBF1 (putative translation factor)
LAKQKKNCKKSIFETCLKKPAVRLAFLFINSRLLSSLPEIQILSTPQAGLFQVDLAKMIKMDEMTIVNWETGRTKPTRKSLEKLQEIMGVFEVPIH